MALVKGAGNIFPEIKAGVIITHGGVGIFPLYTSAVSRLDYEVAGAAIQSGQVSVSEVGDEGTVSCLRVRNVGESQVFFMEGEQLVGGKQNRTLNTSLLAGSKSDLKVPVSCVERGRWRYHGDRPSPEPSGEGDSSIKYYCASPNFLSSEVRNSLRESVSGSLERKSGHSSSQAEVWDEIDKEQRDLDISSRSSDVEDTYHTHRKKLAEFKNELAYPEGAVGLAASLGGRFVSFDIFDKASTCELFWPRLVSGYTISSMKPHLHEPRRVQGGEVEEPDIDRFIKAAREATWKLHKAVGDGVELRVRTKHGLEGFVLQYEDQLVHGSLLATR